MPLLVLLTKDIGHMASVDVTILMELLLSPMVKTQLSMYWEALSSLIIAVTGEYPLQRWLQLLLLVYMWLCRIRQWRVAIFSCRVKKHWGVRFASLDGFCNRLRRSVSNWPRQPLPPWITCGVVESARTQPVQGVRGVHLGSMMSVDWLLELLCSPPPSAVNHTRVSAPPKWMSTCWSIEMVLRWRSTHRQIKWSNDIYLLKTFNPQTPWEVNS